MQFKNVTRAELDQALRETNKEFDNNVTWNNPYATLRIKDTHKKGSRFSQSYLLNQQLGRSNKGIMKHLASACWHVHGVFFEKLLAINPQAIIITTIEQKTTQIYKDSNGEIVNNWIDWNIGSIMYPLYYSEACKCGNKPFTHKNNSRLFK